MSSNSRQGFSRQGSTICLPSVRISKRAAILYTIIFLIFITATVDTLRTFIVNERALLTSRGRERFRTRRRTYKKNRMCDETDEPKPWRLFNSGWRSLSSCVEYDLSLRRRQLGDEGVRRLVYLLGRKEYATRDRQGQLKVLNLERQGITRRGAGYLARWLSVDPIEADDKTADLVDVARMPTAAFRSIFINLKGNPIGLFGVRDLERAVDKAKINGIKVVIVGGGSSSDDIMAANGERQKGHKHMIKLGPIEYTRQSVEMRPWRLPVPLIQKFKTKVKAHSILPSLKALFIFCIGVTIGRTSLSMVPYRLVVVRVDSGGG